MKKVKGKYIRLTEQDLHRIIQEQIQTLLEYKLPRKSLVEAAQNHVCQLVMHWCAVRFFEVSKLKASNFAHWKNEVYAFMSDIARIKLKGSMNDFDSRKKAIEEGFEGYDVLSSVDSVFDLAVSKLTIENVDVDSYDAVIKSISQECFDELPKIVDMIAEGDNTTIRKYCQGL